MFALVLGLASGAVALGVNLDNVPDGTYSGEGEGFNDAIEVDVIVEGGEVVDIEVVSQEETPDFWEDGVQTKDDIIAAQSTDVDTETGATASSEGIVEAVQDALAGAEDDPDEVTEVEEVDVGVKFNEDPLVFDKIFIEDGRTYVDSESLEDQGFEVDEFPEVKLRPFFEDKGADVEWDGETKSICITLVEEYDAEELLQETGENIIDENTFKIDTEGEMGIKVAGEDEMMSTSQEEVEYTVEERFSIDPQETYKKQTVEFPVLEFMSPESDQFPLPLDEEGELELEVVHKNGQTYSKLPQEDWTQAESDELFSMLGLIQQIEPEVYSQWAEVLGIDIEIAEEDEDAGLQAYNLSLDEEIYNVLMEDKVQENVFGLSVSSIDMDYELLVNPSTGLPEQLNEETNIEFSVCADELGLDKEEKIKFEFNVVAQSEFIDYGEDVEIPSVE